MNIFIVMMYYPLFTLAKTVDLVKVFPLVPLVEFYLLLPSGFKSFLCVEFILFLCYGMIYVRGVQNMACGPHAAQSLD